MTSKLASPIAVLGSNGFIGKSLYKYMAERYENVLAINRNNLSDITLKKPQTVFNCIGYGSNRIQHDVSQIYYSNFHLVKKILDTLFEQGFESFIHAGSASEKDLIIDMSSPYAQRLSHYGASKYAASLLLQAYGDRGKRIANLRLFSVYGPGEKESKLFPRILSAGAQGHLPSFPPSSVYRDYIHIDDVCRAFEMAAANLLPQDYYGNAFDIGTGSPVSFLEVAEIAQKIFKVKSVAFEIEKAIWDNKIWKANVVPARECFGFQASIGFEYGFRKMVNDHLK